MNASSYAFIAIDPVAFSIGPLSVHWYGIMYLLAFLFFLVRGNWLARHRTWWGWSTQDVSDFLFYAMIGVVLGGRMGYVFFYALDSLLEDPLFLFKINQGGMSFHGGLVGAMLAAGWFARRTHRTFWQVADFVAPLATIGLGLGRLGNFIGGELWGRLTDVQWAMIFPNSIEPGGWSSVALREAWMRGELDSFARHPSQLYQVVLEGLVLYALLAWYSRVPRPVGTVAGLFLAGYGCFRIAVEFFREPDSQLGFLAWNWLTMGMLLSLPMIALGLFISVLALRRAGAGDSRPRSGQGGK